MARVLDLKHRLGLFEDPFRRCSGADPDTPARRSVRRAAARDAAVRALVLLQNRGGVLPLPPSPGRIALIGPLADARDEMLGPWAGAGRGDEAIDLLAGLRAASPDATIDHVRGVPIEEDDASGIDAAVAAADRADHIVLCLGEAAWMSGEAASRAGMDLPGRQAELAAAVLSVGKPVVVLLFSGRPIVMPEVFAKAAAVVACWFPGSEAGHAIAALLTGDADPSAGLAVTWPREVGQVPIAYSVRSGGRPENREDKYTSKYLDVANSPQFTFGHGLTYTSFTLGDPVVSGSGPYVVEASVTNTGARPGVATVFLFIRDPVASVARPVLELLRFQKAELGPGESRSLRLQLARHDFAFLGPDLRPVVESGTIELHVGFSADPDALRGARLTLD